MIGCLLLLIQRITPPPRGYWNACGWLVLYLNIIGAKVAAAENEQQQQEELDAFLVEHSDYELCHVIEEVPTTTTNQQQQRPYHHQQQEEEEMMTMTIRRLQRPTLSNIYSGNWID